MAYARLMLPKGLLAKLGNVPFDVFEAFEGINVNTVYNLQEQFNCMGGKWSIRETSGLNALTVTVDRNKVYTIDANSTLESEIIIFSQVQIDRGAGGIFRCYLEGWSSELIEELRKRG